ncbi:MAG: hypothetical protein ACRDYF_11575 [Acidimicrobiia bacterium]
MLLELGDHLVDGGYPAGSVQGRDVGQSGADEDDVDMVRPPARYQFEGEAGQKATSLLPITYQLERSGRFEVDQDIAAIPRSHADEGGQRSDGTSGGLEAVDGAGSDGPRPPVVLGGERLRRIVGRVAEQQVEPFAAELEGENGGRRSPSLAKAFPEGSQRDVEPVDVGVLLLGARSQ